jgi:hypothetical protein
MATQAPFSANLYPSLTVPLCSSARMETRETNHDERSREMGLTLRNIGVGARSARRDDQREGGFEEAPVVFWDDSDRRARYNAVSDACWIYQYRRLEENLRRLGWRQARMGVLAHGALSREWTNRGHGDLRLTRGGLQMRFAGGVRTMGWKDLKGMIEARRS